MTTSMEMFAVGGSDVAWRETGGEIVILDLTGAVYFGLNGTGAQLWKQLIDGASREDLVANLTVRTPQDSPRVASDVDAFLAELDHCGLLRRL
jgi:hypothetical protein